MPDPPATVPAGGASRRASLGQLRRVPSSIKAAFPDNSIILIRTSSYSLAMIKSNRGRSEERNPCCF